MQAFVNVATNPMHRMKQKAKKIYIEETTLDTKVTNHHKTGRITNDNKPTHTNGRR